MNKPVVIESIIPLSPDQLAKLQEILTTKVGEVSLENKVNPLLIGGIKLHLNDKVLDLSIITRLNEIEKNLFTYAQE